jgi:hypothetical protein
MRRTLLALSLLILAGPAWAAGSEPFKLGTFEIDGEPRIGLVVRNDTLIVDLAAANRMLERSPYSALPIPATMREPVGRYEYGLKHRLYEIVADLVARRQFEGASRPGSDWFVGKGHDTFAPTGPWIVPKEFYGDPMQRLRQTHTSRGGRPGAAARNRRVPAAGQQLPEAR